MLKITEQYIPKGNQNRPAHPMSPKYITIHDTGNASKGAGAKNHAIYAGRGVNEVGYHFVVDDKNIYQLLPLNENAWHAGDGGNGTGNRQSIAIEICENPESNRATAEKNAQQLTAYLMKKCSIPLSNVKQHYDWNGKNCPHIIRARKNGWSDFVAAVKKEYEALTSPAPAKPSTSGGAGKISVGSTVKVTGTKYATGQTIPGWVKSTTHKVSEISGDRALLGRDGGICSWVYLRDLTLVSGGVAKPGNLYAKGRAIRLNNAALYGSAFAQTAAGRKTGTYYLYDGVEISGRYRITTSATNCGKTPTGNYVTGYINKADIR